MPRINSLGINYKAVFYGKNSSHLVGQVTSINNKDQSRRVKCLRLSLDPKLLKYWSVRKYYWATDSDQRSTEGDIVVVKLLERPLNQYVTHRVTSVLYKSGAIVDPITGKLCHGTKYADEIENKNLRHYIENKQGKMAVESEV